MASLVLMLDVSVSGLRDEKSGYAALRGDPHGKLYGPCNLILSCDEHQAFAKQQRRRKHGTENLAVPLALNRIFFFSKGDAGVEPHPGSIDCVQVTYRFDVRVPNLK